MHHEAKHARLQRPVDAGAHQLLRERQAAEQPALGGRHLAIGLGHDPRGRALEQVQVRHLRRDLRHELDGAGASADHRHALARQRVVMVPVLRVKRLAAKTRQARDIGIRWPAQAAHARHQHASPHALAIGHVELPGAAGVVPRGAAQFVIQAQVRSQAELVGAALQVGADLRLRRKHARPVGVGREGERVQVRLHIAGAARIVVVAPGGPHRAGFLEQGEVMQACLLEADRHAQPGEAGADDGDIAVLGGAVALRRWPGCG